MVVKESSDFLFPGERRSFGFNIQECSRSLYAFIAFRQTCFAWCLVTRNLHETLSRFKNNSRRITYGIGRLWGMPSLSPLSSLGCRLLANEKIPDNEHNVFNKLQKSESTINVGIIFFLFTLLALMHCDFGY